MRSNQPTPPDDRGATPRVRRVGSVSYLNAKPLVDGVEAFGGRGVSLGLDVPAKLAAGLGSGAYDVALCPVIDYFRAPAPAPAPGGSHPLVLVPVGGIACEGATLTVRLLSRVPIGELTRVHVDVESHTSVVLMCVLMEALHGRVVEVVPFEAGGGAGGGEPALRPPGNTSGHGLRGVGDEAGIEAMLLIGDKVVTACPSATEYPYQMDLGEAWLGLTGLPFVFATWMARRGEDLGDLPAQLAALLARNLRNLPGIAARYAPLHGWPVDLAERYMTRILRYTVGPRELEGLSEFARRAGKLGLIDGPGHAPILHPRLPL